MGATFPYDSLVEHTPNSSGPVRFTSSLAAFSSWYLLARSSSWESTRVETGGILKGLQRTPVFTLRSFRQDLAIFWMAGWNQCFDAQQPCETGITSYHHPDHTTSAAVSSFSLLEPQSQWLPDNWESTKCHVDHHIDSLLHQLPRSKAFQLYPNGILRHVMSILSIIFSSRNAVRTWSRSFRWSSGYFSSSPGAATGPAKRL